MAFTPWSAKSAKVRMNTAGSAAGPSGPVGGGGPYTLFAKQWECTDATQPADVTNFEGGGYGDWVATILDLDVSISDAEYDFATNVYDSPLTLKAKTILAAQFFLNDLNSPYWYIPNLLIVGNPTSVAVRSTVKISRITGKAKGSFTYPTGSWSPS